MAKFKIGDRVRFTDWKRTDMAGKIGTVKENDSTQPWIDFDENLKLKLRDDQGRMGHRHPCEQCDLELVVKMEMDEVEVAKEENIIKDGTRVYVKDIGIYKDVAGKFGTYKRGFVEFDEEIVGGHSGDCTGKDKHCWFIGTELLDIIKEVEEVEEVEEKVNGYQKAIGSVPKLNYYGSNWTRISGNLLAEELHIGVDTAINKIKEPKKTIMNKISTFVKRLIDPDTQALIEAGFISQDTMTVSYEGQNQLNEILFFANKAELVKLAKAKLAEEKGEKTKK